MIIKMIEGSTRQFGAPKDWDGDLSKCNVLPILDVDTPQGWFMVSAWEPSPAELKALQEGQTVKLWVQGMAHPVVALTVGDVL